MGAPTSFGDLLRGWRKARGLSQLALADRADVSTRHLSFLETGRAAPSREMILRLGRTLEVPLAQRNALLEAAGFAPTFKRRALDDEALAPVHQALRQLIDHHAPYGAIVADASWNLVMVNQPFATLLRLLLGDVPDDLEGLNMLTLVFKPGSPVREAIRNFDVIAPHYLAQVQQEARAPRAPAALRQRAEELAAWAGPLGEPEGPALPLLPLIIEVAGLTLSLYTAVTTLGSPVDVTLSELRLETYFPADDATRDAMAMLSG
jgi:transcriptional regulator with XRE-family HTH domain